MIGIELVGDEVVNVSAELDHGWELGGCVGWDGGGGGEDDDDDDDDDDDGESSISLAGARVVVCRLQFPPRCRSVYFTDKVQTTNKVQTVIDKVQSGSAHVQGAPSR